MIKVIISRIAIVAVMAYVLIACEPKRTNSLTGTEDIDFSTGISMTIANDTMYNEPIVSIDEYNAIDSIIKSHSVRDTNYLLYKEMLRNDIGDLTDEKLMSFLDKHEIPLDSVSLFEKQVSKDFGVGVDYILNKKDSLDTSISCEVIVNYSTAEFRNLIYSEKAFCSWEPTYKSELYASFIEDVMYMYNSFPSKFKKRYQISVSSKSQPTVTYSLILTELYKIYSRSINNTSDYFIVSTELLDGHYEWAYFRSGNK